MTVSPTLYSSITIGACRLKNRLVALPVFTGYAYPNGRVSQLMIRHYEKLAASGVAMVVLANAAVSPDGVTSRYNLRIDSDEFMPGLQMLADAIKSKGAFAAIQLNHAGRFAKTERPLLVSPVDTASLPASLSAMKDFINAFPLEKRFALTRFFVKQVNAWRRAMTHEEMDRVMDQFYAAAMRAWRAGFDMIELHGANGYLLCEFLSPVTNMLHSGAGDAFRQRASFPLRVIHEIRRDLPAAFPLGYRLMVDEFIKGGINITEAIQFAQMVEASGVSYLSAAAGTFNSVFDKKIAKKTAPGGYLRKELIALTQSVRIPTIISGRIVTPSLAAELLRHRAGDLIGLGRSLRVDNNWVRKAERNRSAAIRQCLNCNWCLKRVVLDQGFACVRWPNMIRQKTDLEHRMLSRNYQSLWVITHTEDVERFKRSLPVLLSIPDMVSFQTPSVLFLTTEGQPPVPKKLQQDFMAWLEAALLRFGYPEPAPPWREMSAREPFNAVLSDEIRAGLYGMAVLVARADALWQHRLCYQAPHRTIGLLGKTAHPTRILVPLDLSDTSLNVLMFLRQSCITRLGWSCLNFVHILSGDPQSSEKQWLNLKRVAGLDKEIQMTYVLSEKRISDAILEVVRTGCYGTVIMGKRGLSGLKRLLMGRVSRGVLHGRTEQTLLLID